MNKIISKYKSLPVIVKASFWFLICSFLQKGISVITTPIFTRLLTTAEYGAYNVFNSWENIIIVIVSLNLFYGVYTRGLVKFEEDRKKFSSSMQGLTVILLLIWLVIYLIFREQLNIIFGLNTKYMITMFIIIWATAVFQFWAAEQRVDYNYKKLVIITILASILNPLLSIIFILNFDDKVYGRILAIAIVSIICYGWMFFKQMFSGKEFFSRKYWKHALKFNIPLVPHYLSQTVLGSSDRIMIEKIVNVASAGIYGLAYSLSLIMILFNTALTQTISPWIYKKIKAKKIAQISPIAYSTLILIAFVNILLIAFAPEAVKIFAPSTYYNAIWVIPPVAMSVYFMYAYDLFAKFEFYFEKTKLIASATVSVAVLNLVLNYIFIRKFGYIAAAYTTLICYILYATFHYIFMRKVCKKECDNIQPYQTKTLLGITSIFLILGFVLMFLYNYPIIRFIAIIIIFTIAILKRKVIIESIKKILNLKKTKGGSDVNYEK